MRHRHILYGNHRGFGAPETHPKVILFPTADLWTYFSPFAWQNSPARATAASIAVWPEDELKNSRRSNSAEPNAVRTRSEFLHLAGTRWRSRNLH